MLEEFQEFYLDYDLFKDEWNMLRMFLTITPEVKVDEIVRCIEKKVPEHVDLYNASANQDVVVLEIR